MTDVRSLPTVMFSGTILPATYKEHPDSETACREFTRDEARKMAAMLTGLPVLVEHDDDTKVGKVVSAWLDETSGELRVMGEIKGNTDTINKIKHAVVNKTMRGLSLSHSYELLIERPPSETEGVGSRLILVKTPLEVSLCDAPARPDAWVKDRATTVCCSYKSTTIRGVQEGALRRLGIFMASAAEEPVAPPPADDGMDTTPASQARDASGRFTVTESEKAAAPAPAAVPDQTAAPTGVEFPTDMDPTSLAAFAARITSDAQEHVRTATTTAQEKLTAMQAAMDQNAEELKELRAQNAERKKVEEANAAKELEAQFNSLTEAGFDNDGLVTGLRAMANTDMEGAMAMMKVYIYIKKKDCQYQLTFIHRTSCPVLQRRQKKRRRREWPQKSAASTRRRQTYALHTPPISSCWRVPLMHLHYPTRNVCARISRRRLPILLRQYRQCRNLLIL